MSFRWILSVAATTALFAGAVAACSSDTTDAAGATAVPDAAVVPTAPAEVDAAPLEDAAAEASSTRLPLTACPAAFSGGCTSVDMPLDWNAPTGRTIPIFIDKIASTSHPKRQVWVLQGGPGGSAAGVVPIGLQIADGMEDVEVLTIEHRGVGFSSRLECPDFAAAHQGPPPDVSDAGVDAGDGSAPPPDLGCFQEMKAKRGDDLRFFTTTNAAKDLLRAIELTRRPDTPVYIYGVSYGTYWAQRFMQIAPNGADGVVLDSTVAPGAQFLSQFDTQGDGAAKKLAELCKLDATCNANLGPDPWVSLQNIKAKLDAGFCSEIGAGSAARSALTGLLQNRELSTYAFALAFRLGRCSEDDVAALKTFASRNIFDNPSGNLDSDGLYVNVGFSELWEVPGPSAAVLKQRFDNAVFPAGVFGLAPVYDLWPRYAPDEYVGKYATTSMPILMLAGTLDMQTPIEFQELIKTHYNGPHQTFVTVPTANHAVVVQSPMVPVDGVQKQCGFEIMASFLKNPTAAVDTSCTTKLAPIAFVRPTDEVSFLLGTSDLWLGVKRENAVRPRSLRTRTIPTPFPRLPRF